jgi:hypothetical protein
MCKIKRSLGVSKLADLQTIMYMHPQSDLIPPFPLYEVYSPTEVSQHFLHLVYAVYLAGLHPHAQGNQLHFLKFKACQDRLSLRIKLLLCYINFFS